MPKMLADWRVFSAALLLAVANAAQAVQLPEDLFDLALENDPTYRAALSEAEAGSQQFKIRRGSVLPQINASAGAQRVDSEIESQFFSSFEETYNSYNYGVNLRQPLFRWDLLSRLERGRIENLAARVKLRRTRQELVGRLTTAYFNVLAAQDALATAKAEQAAVARNLEQVQDRFDVGQIAVTGLREAQARADVAEASAIEAELALINAQDLLSEIVGIQALELQPLQGQHSDVRMKYDNVGAWIDQAMTRNSPVVAATLQYRIAEQDVRQAESGLMPEVDLTASYGNQDSSDSRIGQDATQATIGLEVNVPIYAGGTLRAQKAAAVSRLEQRAAELERARIQAATEVRANFRAVRTADRRIAALSKVVTSSEAALEAVRDGYEVGTRTLVDVLDAEQAALRARRDVNAARYNYLTAMIDLELAAGTVQDGDWQRLNAAMTGKVPAQPQQNSDSPRNSP